MEKFDLILKNGRILDPSQNIDMDGDVAISGKKIAYVGASIDAQAKRSFDMSGFIVCPGLFDVHAHINYRGQANGMPPDLADIPYGVTYVFDAGSTGISAYRALADMLSLRDVKSKLALNVSPIGLIMTTKANESVDPALWDMDAFEEAIDYCGDRFWGFKIRISKHIVGNLGLYPLEKTIELAERYGKKVMIHATNPPEEMGVVSEMLRPGDILSHVYHGTGLDIFTSGILDEKVRASQKRGVIMDVSPGMGNFSLAVAKRAIAEGFYPDTISTDLNTTNWNNPMVFSLTAVMSKFLAMGMSLPEVIRTVTSNAAKAMQEDGLGTLKAGTPADITVLKLIPKKFQHFDKFGNTLDSDQMLTAAMTVVNGRVLYQSTETL